MALNLLSIFKFVLNILRHYLTIKNKYIWGIPRQEGNMAGRCFPILKRGGVLKV